jgi:hypothetical protein
MELRKAGLRAEAVIPFGGAYDARVERVPFPNSVRSSRRSKRHFPPGLQESIWCEIKVKINVKGIGQECPIHTGRDPSTAHANS